MAGVCASRPDAEEDVHLPGGSSSYTVSDTVRFVGSWEM